MFKNQFSKFLSFVTASISIIAWSSYSIAGVTILPGQTINAGGIDVSCVSRGGSTIIAPPREKPAIEIFYCARVSKNFVLKKNRYQIDGKLIASGLDVFQADNKMDCYNSLKGKNPVVPRGWNFSCACADHFEGRFGERKEEKLVKKIYGPNGFIGDIDLEVGQWDRNDPSCSEKVQFARSNDPTCY